MCDGVLFGITSLQYSRYKAMPTAKTFHLECSVSFGSDHKSSRVCKWDLYIVSHSYDTKSLFCTSSWIFYWNIVGTILC